MKRLSVLACVVLCHFQTSSCVLADDSTVQLEDNPAEDGWATEVLQGQINDQWKRLAKTFSASKPFTENAVEEFSHPNIQGDALRPKKQRIAFRDDVIAVRRGQVTETSSFAFRNSLEFAKALDQFRGEHANRSRIQFKIFRIAVGKEAIETHQYVTLFAEATDHQREAHCLWRTEWRRDSTDAVLRLHQIRVLDYEEVISRKQAAKLFSDCTEDVFKPTSSFRDQLSHSLDYWSNQLTSIDVSGMQGCAVGDVNGDGLEDLYVCQSSSLPNRLFIHKEDGRVVDRSAESGVDWHEQTHGALFVDIDNDGDQDLVISTTVALVFMENDGRGHFTLRRKISGCRGAYSISVADYDLDGDLDLYGCVYLAQALRRQILAAPVPFHDAKNGGRNFLLRNDGNWQFQDVTRQVGLEKEAFRRSFACSWEDYDNDGDADLYVANDYGSNNLFRNDQGRFTDVASASGVRDQSFGMSGSWGDFNRDGWMDLYVANMFSAAGNRIVHQDKFRSNETDDVRRQIQYMSRGNSLFQNSGRGTFRDVSAPAAVMMGLWSWASTFADLNGDGYEDLLVANGYLTRPDPHDL